MREEQGKSRGMAMLGKSRGVGGVGHVMKVLTDTIQVKCEDER
jgi:hypothetical protein